jgi:hypothetical protein
MKLSFKTEDNHVWRFDTVTAMTQHPDYPRAVDITCWLAGLTELPPLPPKLVSLTCCFNRITSLPENLPPTLVELDCSYNCISELPAHLPPALEELDCCHNRISELPAHLPPALADVYLGRDSSPAHRTNAPEGKTVCGPENGSANLEADSFEYVYRGANGKTRKAVVRFADAELFSKTSARSNNGNVNERRELVVGAAVNKQVPLEYVSRSDAWKHIVRGAAGFAEYVAGCEVPDGHRVRGLECVHKGGRGNSSDFLFVFRSGAGEEAGEGASSGGVTEITVAVEFKHGATRVERLPQFANVPKPSAFTGGSFEKSAHAAFARVFGEFGLPVPPLDEYVAQVGSSSPACLAEHKATFRRGQRDAKGGGSGADSAAARFFARVNAASKEHIQRHILAHPLRVEELSEYLVARHSEKWYMMHSRGQFHAQKVSADNYRVVSAAPEGSNSYLARTLAGGEMKVLLRWKNGNGIAFPALQIGFRAVAGRGSQPHKVVPMDINTWTQEKPIHNADRSPERVDPNMEFSDLSRSITSKLSRDEKKRGGVFFTPPAVVAAALGDLDAHIDAGRVRRVLEPSCGSGEFVSQLAAKYPDASVTGVELNDAIFADVQQLPEAVSGRAELIHDDFLRRDFGGERFDVIAGNPPYFVMKKSDVPAEYHPHFDGRPNIFILFILRALQLLAPGGLLCFVLPKSFLNCLYYSKTRELIHRDFTVASVVECSGDYIDTKQDTVVVTVVNAAPAAPPAPSPFAMPTPGTAGGVVFFPADQVAEMRELTAGATTLREQGFSVSVGTVVWNQNKSILTDDPSKALLVYSSDIVNNTLRVKKYTNPAKKNYINREGSREPVLVINRGYGVGTYHFSHCLLNATVEDARELLVENHLICVRPTAPGPHAETAKRLRAVARSLNSERTRRFIQLYFGNSAINTTELATVLPIFG